MGPHFKDCQLHRPNAANSLAALRAISVMI